MQIWPGRPYPLGATFDGFGTNFSVFSEVAERVELCLFDAQRRRNPHRSSRDDRPLLARLPPRCAAWPVLRIPRSRSVESRSGPLVQSEQAADRSIRQGRRRALATGTKRSSRTTSLNRRTRRTIWTAALFVPKSVVINPFFDWNSDARPNTPWHRTVVYETHVKGFTKRHPGIPEVLRGTYAGLAHPTAVRYLQRLGITAIELLPVHQFVQDATLRERGLTNYWGYNSIAYFAPHDEYARRGGGNQVQEFKHLVKTMHQAGIEVILDVVYNHTGEGNHLGPILSFKGIDNPAYYRLAQTAPLLHGLHGDGQHAEHAPPARAAADHGQPALLGARDARGWVPVRSRRHACARAARRRSAVVLLRSHSAGSCRQPGEADRRAVGHRRGRVPGRQLPAAVVGVERQVSRHRARFLARRRNRRSRSSDIASREARTSTRGPRAGRTRA